MKNLLSVLFSLGLLCSGFNNISNAAVDNPTCLCDDCTCKDCKCKLCNVSEIKQVAYRPRIIFRGSNNNGGTCANGSCNAPQQSNLFVVPMPQPPQVNDTVNDTVILPTPNAPKAACSNCPANNVGSTQHDYNYSYNYNYKQSSGYNRGSGPVRKFIKKIFNR